MCRTYKNLCDIFPGLVRGAYFKKTENQRQKWQKSSEYNFMVCKILAEDSRVSHILSVCQDTRSILLIHLHPY